MLWLFVEQQSIRLSVSALLLVWDLVSVAASLCTHPVSIVVVVIMIDVDDLQQTRNVTPGGCVAHPVGHGVTIFF
jgi:hypothetical protein